MDNVGFGDCADFGLDAFFLAGEHFCGFEIADSWDH